MGFPFKITQLESVCTNVPADSENLFDARYDPAAKRYTAQTNHRRAEGTTQRVTVSLDQLERQKTIRIEYKDYLRGIGDVGVVIASDDSKQLFRSPTNGASSAFHLVSVGWSEILTLGREFKGTFLQLNILLFDGSEFDIVNLQSPYLSFPNPAIAKEMLPAMACGILIEREA
jgi:hypothetical protein